jgi:hypothetical protein
MTTITVTLHEDQYKFLIVFLLEFLNNKEYRVIFIGKLKTHNFQQIFLRKL